ncbi:MAG: hypothetical protein JWQ19_2334, partial [Subtercola sp.]|nr:hypothetical protein [Subtercola sp.]
GARPAAPRQPPPREARPRTARAQARTRSATGALCTSSTRPCRIRPHRKARAPRHPRREEAARARRIPVESMSELTLLILRFGFLALLWVFVFVIVYAMRSDLFGQRVRKLRDPANVGAATQAAGVSGQSAPGAPAGAAMAGAASGPGAPSASGASAAARASSPAAAPAGGAAAGAAGATAQAQAPASQAPGGFTGLIVGAAATAKPLSDPHPVTPAPQSKVPVFTPLEGSSAGVHPRATTSNAHRLIITSGVKSGTEIALGVDPLTIGRSTDSSVVIRDDYTSTHHARLLNWNNEWVIQDLDSTNGTFLDGKRVTQPTPVPLNTPIKIGATSFELRR